MPSNSTPVAALARKLGELTVLGLLAATALLVLPAQATPFALPKQVAGETAALLSLALLWPALVEGSRWRDLVRTPNALRALLPLVALAAGSTLWSSHAAITRAAFVSFVIGAACVVFWSRASSRGALEGALGWIVVLGVILSGVVIGQHHDWLAPVVFEQARGRGALSSLVGATGDLAAYLVVPILVAQYGILRSETRRGRIAAAVALPILVYGLLLTQTFTAILAASAASVVLWWRPDRRWRVVAVAATAIAATIVAATVLPPLQERLADKGRAVVEGDLDELLTGRLDGWRIALGMMEQRPLTGVGWGAYRAEFAPVKLALSRRGVPFYRAHLFPTFQNAHNEFLEVGAELGALGLLALGWALLEVFRAARAISSPDRRALALAGLVGMSLVAVAYFPFRIAVTAFPYALFVAWTFRTAAASREEME